MCLDKVLDDDAALKVIDVLKQKDAAAKLNYLLCKEAMGEFQNCSGFGVAMDMLEDNPLPAVAIITPTVNFRVPTPLKYCVTGVAETQGVDEVRWDDSWFARLMSLTSLVGRLPAMIGILTNIAEFLVIHNRMRLSVLNGRDTINVMKLIGSTDGFYLSAFFNDGVFVGAGQRDAVAHLVRQGGLSA